MNDAFYIGATGLQTQQKALEQVANNITNMNTTAYKRAQLRFSEMVSQSADPNDLLPTNGTAQPTGYGVAMQASAPIMTQGSLRETKVPTDLAIAGAGLIELMGPNGQTMLWRGGGLKVNDDGALAASNGMPLKAAISVPQDAGTLVIDRSGKVLVTTATGNDPQEIGQIDLVSVKDPSQLRAAGDGLYRFDETTDAQMAVLAGDETAGELMQGYQESSNVDLSQEMVTMLLMQRAYAANARVVQAGDELMGIANGLKR
jgi:flagellar basal-body rod protein FlgG